MGDSRLPLSHMPVYFCFTSPSIFASRTRLYSFFSPTMESHFPDYGFFCFTSPTIPLHVPVYKASLAHK